MAQITWEEIAESNRQQENSVSEKKDSKIFLMFKINSGHYALSSEMIKEILRNNEIFPIPFAPDYIKGVINYYSSPYAAIDFSVLTGNAPIDKKLFIVLNNENEIALQISDMLEFKKDTELSYTPNDDSSDPYFTGTVSYENIQAKILNTDEIIKKVKADLENK